MTCAGMSRQNTTMRSAILASLFFCSTIAASATTPLVMGRRAGLQKRQAVSGAEAAWRTLGEECPEIAGERRCGPEKRCDHPHGDQGEGCADREKNAVPLDQRQPEQRGREGRQPVSERNGQ